MCILVLKKKGVFYPTERIIRNCLIANPNGFAMSFNCDGKVETYASLEADDFLEEYNYITRHCNKNDTAMMVHARIATHGSVNLANCHGWKGNILGTEMAFMHNGILHIRNRDDMTDSETFLRDYLEPCCSLGEFVNTVEEYIGTSKFGFLDGNGNIVRFGNFITERGIDYSNGSYRADRYASRIADPRLWGHAI